MARRRRHRRSTRRGFIQRAAAAGFLTGPGVRWLWAGIENGHVTGTVDGDGEPLRDVRVSDGYDVAITDRSGRFSLQVGPQSGPFLFVVTPSGYWADIVHIPTAQAARKGNVDFHLSASRQSSRFRFVFWTDMHLEGGGVRRAKFRATVKETVAHNPAFVWAQGDITLQGKAGKDYVDCCAGLTCPIRNGAGNHEMIVTAADPRTAFTSLFGPTYYSFDWAGLHCVVLDGNQVVSRDTHWSSVHGRLSDRELTWLRRDLEAKPAGMPVIAGIHIPLVSTYSQRRGAPPGGAPPWTVANAAAVHALLAAHDTRLVLQGHLHENERIVRDGIEYVESQAVSGSWWRSGEGFERGVDNAPRGYRIVEVDGTSITHRYYSSCESHVDAPGDLIGRARAEEKTVFVFNCYDAPTESRVRGRLDDGAWRDMPREPAVNYRLGLTMPHHYYLEVDETAMAAGSHVVEIETAWRDDVFRYRGSFAAETRRDRSVPVIYATDLYHPHDDPDDHFDLATIFALADIDLRGVILDDGAKQRKRPGACAVRQLMALTGREVPIATGLAPKLFSPRDDGTSQPAAFQGGVNLILTTLRQCDDPVTIVSVGSLRDVAAAVNRDPALCAQKVDRLYCFIGDAYSGPGFTFREHNVTLDVNAYRAIMRSGLPVYWVPCFDGGVWKNGGRASFWRASHRALLAKVRDPVKQYFIYALLKKSDVDPVDFLDRPVDRGEWKQVLAGTRNLWCTAVFAHLAGHKIVEKRGAVSTIPAMPGQHVTPFTFDHVLLDVDSTGMTIYPAEVPHYPVNRFRVTDPENYARIMTAATAHLLEQLGRG